MSRWLILLLLLLAPPAYVQPATGMQQISDLDELLGVVRQQQTEQRALNSKREAEFLRDQKQQQRLLQQARREFERRQQSNQPLVQKNRKNSRSIERLEKEYDDVVRDMGDLAGIFHQFAGEFSAALQDSVISMQFPSRRDAMRSLATSDSPPTIDDIQKLWLLVQQEMTEAARIRVFPARVVAPDGTSASRQVLRLGTFSAYSDGQFLRYIPETGELLQLSRQPARRYRRAAEEFVAQPDRVHSITVDPTRGGLLGMMGQAPDLRERLQQGGIIGWIIVVLGIIGLLLTVWRGIYLTVVYRRMQRQLRAIDRPLPSNPMGRVLLAVRDIAEGDEEAIQLKLDEAVLAEMPGLERGNGVIKLLASTSPLLGLLGTVTGMILTFQAISLFGTGDPKLMAGGISQALVTTVLGLVVAIPLMFGHSMIAYLSRLMIQQLDEQCAGVLARSVEAEVAS